MKTASTMKIYLPWLGEFGTEVLRYVPKVHADESEKIVFCEEGKEALYPERNLITIPKIEERQRKCGGSLNQFEIWDGIKAEYGKDYEYIQPASTIGYPGTGYFHPKPLKQYDIKADIVVFPRWRHNTHRMNWQRWGEFINDYLKVEGFSVFAAGTKDMSFPVDCPASWDYDRELDASICAIENSKVRVGLITALDLICMLCGKSPWVLLTEKGMKCNVGRDGANLLYLWQTDIHKVGWKIWPFLNEPYRILEEIRWELTGFRNELVIGEENVLNNSTSV